jgi:predicted transposase YbfD/YdcC
VYVDLYATLHVKGYADTVPGGTTETTQVRTLLDPLDITGALVTADAAHTCAETARYLVEDKNADYLLTIKGNRPALHTAAIASGRELIAAPPDHVIEQRGHGRINRWATWSTGTGEDLGLPHAARLALIRRDVADLAGQPLSKEIAVVATSRGRLTAAEISAHARRHWGIENLEHRTRDTVWHEDDQEVYVGNGPRVMATLRNLSLGLFAIHGITKVKQTGQADRAGHRPPPHASHPADHIASRHRSTIDVAVLAALCALARRRGRVGAAGGGVQPEGAAQAVEGGHDIGADGGGDGGGPWVAGHIGPECEEGG